MKKQHKNARQSLRARLFGTPKRATVSFVGVVALVLVSYIAYGFIWAGSYNLRSTLDYSSADSIRTLILHSTKNVVKDAPVDAKTGDIYFPEAKLYLPLSESYLNLGYNPPYDTGNLYVVDRLVLTAHEASILSARNVDEVFELVPKLQACSRGVLLTYDQGKPSDLNRPVLKNTIKLSNGKTLYAHIEEDCPESADTARLLSTIRPY